MCLYLTFEQDCGMLLSSEAEGRGCYPLDEHILCKNCNAKRIQAMSSKMATELWRIHQAYSCVMLVFFYVNIW